MPLLKTYEVNQGEVFAILLKMLTPDLEETEKTHLLAPAFLAVGSAVFDPSQA